jgi:hypothetical protein
MLNSCALLGLASPRLRRPGDAARARHRKTKPTGSKSAKQTAEFYLIMGAVTKKAYHTFSIHANWLFSPPEASVQHWTPSCVKTRMMALSMGC